MNEVRQNIHILRGERRLVIPVNTKESLSIDGKLVRSINISIFFVRLCRAH
jgi:hypothetical protein